MQVKITVTARGNVQGKLSAFAAKVGNAVQNAGLVTEGSAKQRCLVDTGRLRSSIKYTKKTALSCSIGTNVKYGPDIEFGHVTRNPSIHVAAHPFMFPGYLDGKAALLDELKSLS
ncbi:hypothetical protein ccbrp13_56370 [Ktedonobacteria bacterium brp13]|nr:hypothetical protein ccbrp13_56370 [Ktedonobacteria bacterium brp13]